MDEDNDTTIIQGDIDAILQKYKIYDPCDAEEDFVQQKRSKFEISDDEESRSSEISYSLKQRLSQKFKEEIQVAKKSIDKTDTVDIVCAKIDNSKDQLGNFEDTGFAKLLAKYADSASTSKDTMEVTKTTYYQQDINCLASCTEEIDLINNIPKGFQMQISNSDNCKNDEASTFEHAIYYQQNINSIGSCTEDIDLINNISKRFQMQISNSDNCKNVGASSFEHEACSAGQPINLSGDDDNAPVPTQIESNIKKKNLVERYRKQKEDNEESKKVKEIKKILASANKNLKPEECLKFVTVHIDNEIVSKSYGKKIIKSLEDLGVEYQIIPQLVPLSFTWSRKGQNYFMDDDGKISLTTNEEDTNHLLLLLEWDECVQHVKANTFLSHIQGIKSILPSKRISLMIYGLEGYFRQIKKNSSKNVNEKNKRKSNIDYFSAVKISRKDLDYSLTELQLLCSCCYRFIECEADLGLMVSQFTKSIAQIPYKKRRKTHAS